MAAFTTRAKLGPIQKLAHSMQCKMVDIERLLFIRSNDYDNGSNRRQWPIITHTHWPPIHCKCTVNSIEETKRQNACNQLELWCDSNEKKNWFVKCAHTHWVRLRVHFYEVCRVYELFIDCIRVCLEEEKNYDGIEWTHAYTHRWRQRRQCQQLAHQ